MHTCRPVSGDYQMESPNARRPELLTPRLYIKYVTLYIWYEPSQGTSG